MNFYKISHGAAFFTAKEHLELLNNKRVSVDAETGNGQNGDFEKVPEGSWVYVCNGNRNVKGAIGRLGKVVEKNPKHGWTQREFELHGWSLEGMKTDLNKVWTPRGMTTFYRIPESDLQWFEQEILKGKFGRELTDFSGNHGDAKVVESSLKLPVNKIYYGPPGTGKTYELQRLQREQYTDELAAEDLNLRLQEKLKNRTWAEVICLIFLDENRMLRVPEIVEHRFFQAKLHTLGRSENMSQTAWGVLQRHAPLDSRTVKYSLEKRASQSLFDKDEAGLWQLLDTAKGDLGELEALLQQLNAPAQSGQTVHRYRSVTFHQSYGYEDFIEGLRPVMDEDDDSSQVGYEIRSGVFVELCERARHDPSHQYALFIDEINRGNVSRIFGELISLIELDKREGEENALSVVLPYSREPFSIPCNVSIYGSMNSADRSLTPLDTALRRRFEFVEVMPEPGLLGPVEGVDVPQLLGTINQRIEALIGRDYVIGHAYFLPIKNLDDLRQVFLNKIIPLLAEYFFEDWSKILLVLADHLKPAEQQMVQEVNTDAQALFGPAPVHLLPRHRINPALQQADGVFAQPDAYRAVYVWPGATG